MDVKKVLIIGAVIAGAYWLYQRSKNSTSTTSTEGGETSSANGAQLLAIAKNGGSAGTWSGATGSGTWVMCAGIKTWCPSGESNCCARSRTAIK